MCTQTGTQILLPETLPMEHARLPMFDRLEGFSLVPALAPSFSSSLPLSLYPHSILFEKITKNIMQMYFLIVLISLDSVVDIRS